MSKIETIESVSMKMILCAGDSRSLLSEAVKMIELFNFDGAEEKIKEASDKIKEAHIHQTKIIQSQAQGQKYEFSILFTHAQDSLMTINSEVLLIKSMLNITKAIINRERFENQ